MEEYNRLVKLAYELVDIADKSYESGNNMGYFVLLNGIGNGKVSINPGVDHNYQAVIDAIHLYQKDNPNKNIKERYEESLLKTIKLIRNQTGVQNVINYINYELKVEQVSSSTFELEWKEILTTLRQSIIQLYNELKSNNANFDNWIQEQNDYMKQKYGKSF